MKPLNKNRQLSQSAFTIVELLVVIVVIGILAAITIVSYTGISSRAVAASLQSDLASSTKKLNMYFTEYNSYPTALNGSYCPTAPIASTTYCLSKSSGNSIDSYSGTATNYYIKETNGSSTYQTTANTSPTNTSSLTCPTGFIPVPGSATYSTTNFCVMKYEAKILGNNNGNQAYNSSFVPDSRVTGTPWVNINQTDAIAESQTYPSCTGCHLLTDAEWMTIAQNVLSVASNWSSGIVGSGFIYSGHTDGTPNNTLDADSNDSNGYYGTGNVSNSNQKRTLTLSNGEVIWDLAGNIQELINGNFGGGGVTYPGLIGEVSYSWKEWNNGSLIFNGLPALSRPSSTGITGASGWSSANGIGQIYTNISESVNHIIRHGGNYLDGATAGVLATPLNATNTTTASYTGFRIAR